MDDRQLERLIFTQRPVPGPEFDLLPAQRRAGVATMAYSPIEQGRLLRDPALEQVAARHDASPAQVLLAWAIRDGDVIAIPKASRPEHVEANAAAADLARPNFDAMLTGSIEDPAVLDQAVSYTHLTLPTISPV